MLHSRYAIVVFEKILQPDFNPNVALELGYMLALRRPCLILKEKSMPILHTDIIGHLYTPFDAQNIKATVASAIESWLEKLGHPRVKVAETITARSTIKAYKKRTDRIVKELSETESDAGLSFTTFVVRQAASLSSLAISNKERHEDDNNDKYKNLLLLERDRLKSLLEKGATIKLIISPDTQVSRVQLGLVNKEFVKINILTRYDELIKTIEEQRNNPNLQIVYAHRLPQDNLLILGESRVFIGRKRIREKGFPHTTLVYDPVVIHGEVYEFDILFRLS